MLASPPDCSTAPHSIVVHGLRAEDCPHRQPYSRPEQTSRLGCRHRHSAGQSNPRRPTHLVEVAVGGVVALQYHAAVEIDVEALQESGEEDLSGDLTSRDTYQSFVLGHILYRMWAGKGAARERTRMNDGADKTASSKNAVSGSCPNLMLGIVRFQEELAMAVARELCKLIVLRLPRKLFC